MMVLGSIAGPHHHALAQRATIVDVVLVGGRVLDPETNLDAVRTVGIKGGKIVSVTTAVPTAHDTVDVRDSSSRPASSISTRTVRIRPTTSTSRATV